MDRKKKICIPPTQRGEHSNICNRALEAALILSNDLCQAMKFNIDELKKIEICNSNSFALIKILNKYLSY